MRDLRLEPTSLEVDSGTLQAAAKPAVGDAVGDAVGPAGDAAAKLIGQGDLTHLGFFTDRDALERLVKQEEEMLVANNNRQLAEQLHLWRTNNFAEVLESAKAEKRLTSWHLAIAPMVSPRVWRDTCVAYATQLTEKDRVPDAADMLIAARRPREAIDLLLSSNLFREAMVVARCQMFDQGEAASEVLRRWAEYGEGVGNYELALDCYVSLGDCQRAARLQGCRQDSASLQLAAHLAARGSAPGLEFTLAQQCLQTALADENWARAAQVLSAHRGLEAWVWLTEFYRELLDFSKVTMAQFNQRVWVWLEGARTDARDLQGLEGARTDARDLDLWGLEGVRTAAHDPDLQRLEGARPDARDLDLATPALQRVADKCAGVDLAGAELMLRTLQMTEPTTSAQLLILVSASLAVSATRQRWADKCLVWTSALSACYTYQQHNGGQLLLRVFTFLFPKGPRHLPTSLQAYGYAGLLSWLQSNMWFHRTESISAHLSNLLAAMSVSAPSVFDADGIFHFKTVGRIEESERNIAAARAVEGGGSKRGRITAETDTTPEGLPSETPAETDTTPEGLPSETPAKTDTTPEGLPSETPAETDTTPEGLPSETPAETDATPEGLPSETPAETHKSPEDDPAIRFINRLRASKQRFVERRHSAPNPFVAFAETKNMFACCSFAEGKEFLALAEEIWARADARAAEMLRDMEAEQQLPSISS